MFIKTDAIIMWITVVLLSLILYAVSQIFEKQGSDVSESHTELKFFVWYGIICFVFSLTYTLFGMKEGNLSFFEIVKLYPQALLSPLLYAVSLIASFIAFRHIPVYIESPASSTAGIFYLAEVILLFKLTGRDEFTDEIMNPLKLGLIIAILVLVFICSIFEGEEEKAESAGKGVKPLIVFGAVLAIFSAMTDAASSVVDAYYISDISDSFDYICFHNYLMAIFAMAAYVILWATEKKPYNPFKRSEKSKMLGSGADCLATAFYMLALSLNPIYSDAIIAAYFIFSIILSRIILKEKPNKKQYVHIILLVILICAFIVAEELM